MTKTINPEITTLVEENAHLFNLIKDNNGFYDLEYPSIHPITLQVKHNIVRDKKLSEFTAFAKRQGLFDSKAYKAVIKAEKDAIKNAEKDAIKNAEKVEIEALEDVIKVHYVESKQKIVINQKETENIIQLFFDFELKDHFKKHFKTAKWNGFKKCWEVKNSTTTIKKVTKWIGCFDKINKQITIEEEEPFTDSELVELEIELKEILSTTLAKSVKRKTDLDIPNTLNVWVDYNLKDVFKKYFKTANWNKAKKCWNLFNLTTGPKRFLTAKKLTRFDKCLDRLLEEAELAQESPFRDEEVEIAKESIRRTYDELIYIQNNVKIEERERFIDIEFHFRLEDAFKASFKTACRIGVTNNFEKHRITWRIANTKTGLLKAQKWAEIVKDVIDR